MLDISVRDISLVGVVGAIAFGVGYLVNRYIQQDFELKNTKREEKLLQNITDPTVKKAYAILRSEREELLNQLQENDAKSKKVISEIRAEREELLYQLLDKSERFTLTYFDSRGRAEQLRILLAECGNSQYVDNRIDKDKWTELKPNTPMGCLPILEHHGKLLGESMAQMVYIAKLYDRWPTKIDIEAQALMILCTAEDLRQALATAVFASDQEKPLKTEKLYELLRVKLPFFEKVLERDGFFISGRITASDISVWDVLDQTVQFTPQAETIIQDHKAIESWRRRVATRTNIAAYLEKRK